MTKKKKIEVTLHDEEIGSYINTGAHQNFPCVLIPLQEPKVTDVARLRAQKALEANVKRGKK